jgi:spore coat polysaccharide biosynthesis protein SpsF
MNFRNLNNEKVVVIIQARMGSTRLPGKVLLDLGGKPMLARVVSRCRQATMVDQVVIATSDDPSDDAIENYCLAQGYPCFRGSLHDVLDRYYQAARQFEASIIVRITADCPLIDPAVIDQVVSALIGREQELKWDFVANRLPPPWKRSYPIGLDVEVCTFSALERAWKEAKEAHQREHVMPYLYEQEGRFQVLVLNHIPDYGDLRWTVDTPEDLALIRQIYSRFDGGDGFSWMDVIELFQHEPALAEINASVAPKRVDDVDERRSWDGLAIQFAARSKKENG